ncbi:MAG: condensation domain-containing protein [Cyanobacteria bacterium J06656_5]
MTIKQELHQRLAALSPSQRASLAQQLDQLGVSERSSQRLVAYVVGRSAEVDTAVLRDDLKAKLPNYMVPTAIVPLVQMPRTANGKVDTNALPDPQPVVTTANGAAPRTSTEEILVQIWKDVLGLGAVGIDDNFFELGGDSILSIQIVSRAREAGLRLAPNQLFEQPTVAELAAVVNVAPEVVATQEVVTGEVPLTPIQTWFFEQDLAAPQHWHQAMLVELPEGVSEDQVEGAIATLWTHHDALRLRFDDRQHIADISDPPALTSIDLTHLNASDQLKAVAHQGTHLHNDLNLAGGGLLQTARFSRGAAPDRLLLSLHHLAVDAVSWQILLDDLSTLLGGAAQLPAKTTSFKTWAETLTAQVAARQPEAPYWFTQTEQSVIQLPRDFLDGPPSTEGTAQTVTVALSQPDTQALLQTVPASYNTQINDTLLTALTLTLLHWVGAETGHVRIEIEAHGREPITPDIDVSRTVGWFTTTYPVSLHGHVSDAVETLKSVKEQLRQVPDRGIGHGILRYLGDGTTQQRLAQSPPSEVLFNYLGQQVPSGLQVLQAIDVGTLRDPRNQRSYLLELNAWVADGQLQVTWRYDPQIHRSDTLQSLAHQYLSQLKSLIAHCTDTSGGFTPSDFPDADFNQTELDDFIGQLTGQPTSQLTEEA